MTAIRAELLGSTNEVTVHGWARGDNREVIIVSRQGQDIVVLDAAWLDPRFQRNVEEYVPPELRDAVVEWVKRAARPLQNTPP